MNAENKQIIEDRLPGQYRNEELKERLTKILNQTVVVVGDVGVDRYTLGVVERISPEAPVPVLRVENEGLKLGLAGNVAENIQALASTAKLIGVIGEDRNGEDLERLMSLNGISSQGLVRDAERRTVLKERILSERQQLIRVDYENIEPMSERTRESILTQLEEDVSHGTVVVLEDYGKGLVDQTFAQSVIEIAGRAKLPVLVDPPTMTELPASAYRGATMVTPNQKETERFVGFRLKTDQDLIRAGRLLIEQTHSEYVVITLGKKGMAVFERESDRVIRIPTTAREVYDVSGAGDTVIAILALGMSGGLSVIDAAVLGNLAAGIVVGKRGTATVTPSEIRAEIDRVTHPVFLNAD